jgi:hypothetical protein
MTDAINKALDLVPYEEQKTDLVKVEEVDEQADGDIEYARRNLYDVVSAASEAVDDMISIARQSQHPKAYEVLNSVLKTKADVAMNLADLQMKKQRLRSQQNNGVQNQDGQTIHNNLFVGSTAELQQMLADMRDNNVD